ncbi:cytochrome [Sphingomonas panacis]|uniref:Cytochrome n=1 Tax=Sphingomonas panacis TaxID=1560345 RepID=A0A1B3ZGF6_9SPHN|nr:cytochrome [Sphingomonas panacis]
MAVSQNVANALVDPGAYGDLEQVDTALAWLRREAPFTKVQPQGYDEFWAVTRHSDILAVERAPDLFHNEDRSVTVISQEAERSIKAITGGSPNLSRNLTRMDNPDHAKYRAIAQLAMTPAKITERSGRIREIAREFVGRLAERDGECDFARDIAFLYPLRVVMEILGVPEEDEPLMLRLTQEAFGTTDPDVNRAGAQVSEAQRIKDLTETLAELRAYFADMTIDRRRNPRDDFASVLANARIDGELLPDYELFSYFGLVAAAGHDTTANVTAGGVWALAERPDQVAKLKQDPKLVASYVEEAIRWVTPVKHFMRTAMADTEVAGQKVSEGDWLMLCYHSGNRDEGVFTAPYEFDVTRRPNKQIAFGYGPHMCLGQHLGRLEIKIFMEELLPRLESMELSGVPTRTKSNFVSGPKSIPIRYKLT